MVNGVILRPSAWEAMVAHARAAYPEECCGLLVGPPHRAGVLTRAAPCRNLQNLYHQRFPEDYPRDARTAYLLDFRDLERTEEEAVARGERVAGIFHSHVDVGAYFSDEDRRVALLGGEEPTFPDFVHIVIDARAGDVRGARAYRWDPAARDFGEVPLEVEER
jgi:adenylyltransferase/sulfurtransferase